MIDVTQIHTAIQPEDVPRDNELTLILKGDTVAFNYQGQVKRGVIESIPVWKYSIARDGVGDKKWWSLKCQIKIKRTEDGGTKKSLKGLQAVHQDENGDYYVVSECDWEEEQQGVLQTIYEDGKFYNQTTLTQIRELLRK